MSEGLGEWKRHLMTAHTQKAAPRQERERKTPTQMKCEGSRVERSISFVAEKGHYTRLLYFYSAQTEVPSTQAKKWTSKKG